MCFCANVSQVKLDNVLSFFKFNLIIHVLVRLTGDIKGEKILSLFFEKGSYEKHFKV